MKQYIREGRAYFFALVAGVILLAWSPTQNFAPPPSKKPNAKNMQILQEKNKRLGKILAALRRQGVSDPWLADTEVYHQAVNWIIELDEFYQPESAAWALEAADRGLLRASFLAQGQSPWGHQAGYPVIKAYRSRIDGSVQPYAVTYPADYGKDPLRKWRLDVVLHGRDTRLNEVKFLHQFNGDQEATKDQDYVRINIFGRGNNAYRWAGESDVFEVLEHFTAVEHNLGRGRLLDKDRIVLRGFSMGGAGTWHLGLHCPDRWCLLGPGAGFTTTHGYVKNLPARLPPYQEACLSIYDAVDYAENAFDVPVVAYSGAEDPQKQAADNIEQRLKKLGIPMTHLVAPGLKHQFPLEWQKKAEALYAKHVDKGLPEYPAKIRFVTYTLRYPACHWVRILSLDKHFKRTAVEAEKTEEGFTVRTENVRALRLTMPLGAPPSVTVKIDGQEVSVRPWLAQGGKFHVFLERRRGKWTPTLLQRLAVQSNRMAQKITGLQGPIDDAFMDSFLCVRGTGAPWHKATGAYADGALDRFQKEWAKFWRGRLPVKDDIDVDNQDIASRNLILFGDPSSNSLIAQVLDGLPLQWTKEAITFAGKKYQAGDHVPVMIFPSPLNTTRYVILNSGHTFHTPDYLGTNALLFPRLGDYAMLRLAPTENEPLGVEVVRAGLYDDFWRINTASEK